MRSGGGDAVLDGIRFHLIPYTRRAGIEIGRGPIKAFPHFVGVREYGDESITADDAIDLRVESFDKLGDAWKEGSLDHVFVWGDVDISDDVIEPLLREGGYYIDCATRHAELPVDDVYRKVNGRLELQGPLVPSKPPYKTACIVRYGGIGDYLQAAALLPELKRQGYHITWMCEPVGEVLLRHDPHIDAFYVQDKDQVPNHELEQYWAVHRKWFDKWINLCGSVESTLLPRPIDSAWRWPHAARDAFCNKNYLEFQALIAEQDFHPEHHFYPAPQEVEKVGRFKKLVGENLNPDWKLGMKWREPLLVMFALAGSSIHKAYPHTDAVVQWILDNIPEAHVIFVGGEECKLLEQGWEENPRVTCACGEMPIRETLALAQRCDIVIGPETGVLNAVAFEDNAKILMLSHSSKENLSRDWVNTWSLHGDTPCYPCHRMHNDFSGCMEHEESGTAMCQWTIPPGDVIAAVKHAYVSAHAIRKLREAA